MAWEAASPGEREFVDAANEVDSEWQVVEAKERGGGRGEETVMAVYAEEEEEREVEGAKGESEEETVPVVRDSEEEVVEVGMEGVETGTGVAAMEEVVPAMAGVPFDTYTN